MTLLSKDDILNSDDLEFRDIDIPEWGGTVRIKELTAFQRDKLESEIVTRKGKKTEVNLSNLRSKMASLTIVDDKGKRIFSPNDIVALGKKSASALDKVFDVARELSGMTDSDVKDLTENFTEGENGDSPSS